MSLDEVGDLIRRSEILIDIVRPGHAGLSFRFFDALFYRKKIITNNPSVMNYDFMMRATFWSLTVSTLLFRRHFSLRNT